LSHTHIRHKTEHIGTSNQATKTYAYGGGTGLFKLYPQPSRGELKSPRTNEFNDPPSCSPGAPIVAGGVCGPRKLGLLPSATYGPRNHRLPLRPTEVNLPHGRQRDSYYDCRVAVCTVKKQYYTYTLNQTPIISIVLPLCILPFASM
jgi:hypothetical protein